MFLTNVLETSQFYNILIYDIKKYLKILFLSLLSGNATFFFFKESQLRNF